MRLPGDPPWRPEPDTGHPFGGGEYDRQGRLIARQPIEQSMLRDLCHAGRAAPRVRPPRPGARPWRTARRRQGWRR